MNMTHRMVLVLLTLVIHDPGLAQTEASRAEIPPAPVPVAKGDGQKTQSDREAELIALLKDALLVGYWQVTTEGGLKSDGPLSEPKPETYTVSSATKLVGDRWIIASRIQYADKDVTIPVPVRIIWAEDVAIITLDSIPLPILGTYSARVMFHNGFYSGVWYSKPKNYGGVLSGRVLKQKTAKTDG